MLLLVGFVLLPLLLHALQRSDEEQSQQLKASAVDRKSESARAGEAYSLSLAQSLLLIDAIKVLALVGTAPQLLARVLPPHGSRRNRLILAGVREFHKLLEALA